MILFILQPDFGSTVLLIGIWLVQFFMINNLSYIKRHLSFIALCLPVALIIKGGYVIKRIKFILNPDDEVNQINLAVKAIKFSQWMGSKREIYIPEMHNDYFFSSFINLYGMIPAISLLLLWLFFIHYLLNINKKITNLKDKNIIMGSLVFLMGQSMLHIFTNLNLIPPKGISFPLISAGGSLLISNMIGLGIIIHILDQYGKDKSYK
jgi:cell division protein FtsW